MDVPHSWWGRKGPLSLIAAAFALVALTPAPAAAEQRVSSTASKLDGCGWPAGWSAGAVAFGTGYSRPSGSLRVREVQRRLKRAGARPGPVDGLFGPLTRAAVKRLQRRHHVAPTGVVGRRTLALLRSRTGRGNDRTGARRSDDESRTGAGGSNLSDAAQQSAPTPPSATESSPPAIATVLALVLGLLLLAAAVIHELRGTRRGSQVVAANDEPPRDGNDDAGPVLGYVTVSRDEAQAGAPQSASEAIGSLCEQRGWPLLKVVHDVEPQSDRITDHPGLFHVL